MSSNGTVEHNGTGSTSNDTLTSVLMTVVAVGLSLVVVLAVTLNGLLCLVFHKRPVLLNVSNSFVLNLSVCQIGISILVLPLSLVSTITQEWMLSEEWCQYQGFLFTVFIVTTMLSLAMISIDRHYAITNSLRYPYVFTQTRCLFIIGMGWLTGVSLALPPLFNSDLYGYEMVQFRCGVKWDDSGHNTGYLASIVAVCYVLPMVVMLWCYCSIFRVAMKHRRSTCRIHPSTGRPSDPSAASTADCARPPAPRSLVGTCKHRHRRLDCKATRTIFVILTTYFVCWLPYVSVCIAHLAGQGVNDPFETLSIFLVYSSTSVNPVVYGFMNRDIREELMKYVYQILRRHTIEDIRESEESRSQTLTTSTSGRKVRHCPDIWTTSSCHDRCSDVKSEHKSVFMERISEETEHEECTKIDNNDEPNSSTRCRSPVHAIEVSTYGANVRGEFIPVASCSTR